MSKNNFVSHFLPFQINTTIFIFLKFFYKMAAGGHFGCPKITLDRITGHFRCIRNLNFFLNFFLNYFYKMAASAHFGCPKITFGRISGHFRSRQKFVLNFFTKWLPSAILDVWNLLWITFLAILDQYRFFIFFKLFYKMAASGHFGCSKITFDLISGHFRTIQIFIFFYKCPKITFGLISIHFTSIRNFNFFLNFW